jgi:lipooligosaccharide transport system permease protein
MQTAMNESTFPVMAAVKWLKTYQAAAATPLRPGDLFRGHLLFTAMRILMNAAIFLGVMAAFGAIRSFWAIAALPVCVLTGLAFAAPIEAWAITRDKDTSFSLLIRFGLIPLFLFSGTFFPVTQLPGWIQPVAYATPLWHGVALCRSLSLGSADVGGSLIHVAYLVAVTVAGLVAGQYFYRRRLYV